MEVYQQASIIFTGNCSGTRDTSFNPRAACCHRSIPFQYNQWSLDTWGTSRIMANKPSPLRGEQLVGTNNLFSSTRDNEQCINSFLFKWFLKNSFFQNMLGNVNAYTGGHTSTSHRSYIFPLVHKQKKPVARKLNVIYIFFVPLDWSNNSNNKQLYIKTSLPSDLILNTSFLSTQSKAANTTALKSQHRRRESHLTPHGTDCYLDANPLLNGVELNALYPPQEGNPGVKKLQVSISGPNSWTLAIPNVCVADLFAV